MLLSKYLAVRSLLQHQWLSPGELKALETERLRALVAHAYSAVPYYHKLFDAAGIRPDRVRSIADLRDLPVTRKEEIRELPLTELVARNTDISRCVDGKTSGSTGVSQRIILGEEDLATHNAVWNAQLRAVGRRPTDRLLCITSRFPKRYRRRWYEHLGIERTDFLLSTEDGSGMLEIVLNKRPDVIFGYPSRLAVIAKEAETRNIKGISPKVLITSAETLADDARAFINRVFGVRLVDFYGSWETGMIAWECHRHEGYHVNVDSVALEIMDGDRPAQPGETGEVIVTNLNSRTMPFIRYSLGDRAVHKNALCSCGRGLPLLLERIEGRSDEIIVLPSGRLISPNAFDVTIKYVHGVEKFQVIQEEKSRISVLLVTVPGPTCEIISAVESKLREQICEPVILDIKIVDDIPIGPSGKRRCVISKIRPDFGRKRVDGSGV